VKAAFLAHGDRTAAAPSILGIHADRGGFHVKAGIMQLKRNYFVSKTNANFPLNPKNYDLPTIQGVIMISDADNGRLLALTDSTEITAMRTGAATALAASHLSNPDANTASIFGCGIQGRISLRMLNIVRPLQKVWIYDVNHSAAVGLASELRDQLNVDIEIGTDPAKSLHQSSLCVTCTTSTQSFLKKEWIQPGTFIAAVGSDNEDKQELDVSLMASAKIVTDITRQCATIGELHHAIDANALSENHVHAELGEIVAGLKPGRTTKDEIIVFDSTGMALQDITSTVTAYEKALTESLGLEINLMA
jgi:ornithine cyclodeaminase/alanine dehydrogenase-like protein (mu-crystallin family)